jgi:hypothetical protein
MKRLSLLGLSLTFVAGLAGCDRLWSSSLVCPGGSQPFADTSGNPACPAAATDMASSSPDGSTVTPWTPATVQIASSLTDPVSGLRIVSGLVTDSPTSLFVFFTGKTSFDVASFGCSGVPPMLSDSRLTGGPGTVVYDANFVSLGGQPFYYVIYQEQSSMVVASYNPSGTAASGGLTSSLPGATRPGFSNVDPYLMPMQNYLAIVRTDTPQLVLGAIGTGVPMGTAKINFSTMDTVYSGSTDPIAQLARADFNQDGMFDYAFSQYSGSSTGALSACSTVNNMVGCTVQSSKWPNGDLIAVGELPNLSPQLVRVDRSATYVGATTGAAVGLSAFAGAPSLLTTRTQSYSLPAGYTPLFVAAASSTYNGTSAALLIFVAATPPSGGKAVVFAHKVDQNGLLLGQSVTLPLAGTPTAMIVGNYPCSERQQLIIAQTINGGSEVRAYELPAL